MAHANGELVGWTSIACCLAVIALFAAVVSTLPFMGETHFHFAKDFCLFDIEDNAVGATFLVIFLFATSSLVCTSVQLIKSKQVPWWLYPVLLASFLWGFVALVIIVFKDWADDLDSSQTVWGWKQSSCTPNS